MHKVEFFIAAARLTDIVSLSARRQIAGRNSKEMYMRHIERAKRYQLEKTLYELHRDYFPRPV